MLLEEIIKPDSVLCNAQARSKKHCLEILSELLFPGELFIRRGVSSLDFRN